MTKKKSCQQEVPLLCTPPPSQAASSPPARSTDLLRDGCFGWFRWMGRDGRGGNLHSTLVSRACVGIALYLGDYAPSPTWCHSSCKGSWHLQKSRSSPADARSLTHFRPDSYMEALGYMRNDGAVSMALPDPYQGTPFWFQKAVNPTVFPDQSSISWTNNHHCEGPE